MTTGREGHQIVREMAREITGKSEPMEVVLRPMTAMQLAGLLQLACRHPGVSAEARATACVFVEAVREYFADCPLVLDVLRRGDDPAQDVGRDDRGARPGG